jgi:hypothetical protein
MIYTQNMKGEQVSVETVIHICEDDTTMFPEKVEPLAINNYDKNWICVVPAALCR